MRSLVATALAAPRHMVQTSAASLTITRPDDWHLHVREGPALSSLVKHTAAVFGRAVIMPNLTQPVTTTQQALLYKQQILSCLPAGSSFLPLMTLYLTDSTSEEEVHRAKEAGVFAFKLYPAGATTNSDSGVTDLSRCQQALAAMQEVEMPLLIHGEVTTRGVDVFDREKVFIKTKLKPLVGAFPRLKVVLEHITTEDAADFVTAAPKNVAATITPQHILFNRNAIFQGGLRPHMYCLPILKRERHREAVLAAAVSGSPKFMLGTDSAPHPKSAKEAECGCAGIFSAPLAVQLYAQAFQQAGALDRLEAFASFHGPDFHGLPRNIEQVTLVQETWRAPRSYPLTNDDVVVPLWANKDVDWQLQGASV